MTTVSLFVAVTLAVLLALGVWVSVSLLALGIVSLEVFRSLPVDKVLAQNLFGVATSPELLALPLFILMGEILFRTNISEKLMAGIAPWTRYLPGRLLHVNVLASMIFASVCGSSAATTATVGRITYGDLLSKGYSRRAILGSLGGAGTMGLLIPPSTVMIIYGVLADVSIIRLFIAGILPGLMLGLMFIAVIIIWALVDPGIAPRHVERSSWGEKVRGLLGLMPAILLILGVIGSMFLGFATPTEAAAIGVFGSILVSLYYRTFTPGNIVDALSGALKTTSMIGLITVGAGFLSISMGYLGIPRFVVSQIEALNLSPYELILMLIVVYLVLGCFLEGFATIVLTLPLTLPLVVAAGFDPLWFGIFLVIMIETAQITPPIGFNLFVLQGVSNNKLSYIATAVLPFLGALILAAVVIMIFPGIVSYLPDKVMGG